MDLAKRHDKTVIIVAEYLQMSPSEREKGDMYPYKRVVRHVSCPDYNMFSLQLDHLDDVIGRYRPDKIYYDQNNIGDKIGEELYQKYGRRSEGIVFSNKSKYNMALDLIRLFEKKKIEIPYHKVLIYQLNALERKLLPSGKIQYKGDEDDYVWALALATSGQRASGPMIAIETDEGIKIIGDMNVRGIEEEI